MTTPKTILFVTYGGGHIRMVIPVVRELQKDANIHCEILALTTAYSVCQSEGLPCKGYHDFLTENDAQALAWGRKLAANQHTPGSGISEEESIAYLGLNYHDLILQYGEEKAAEKWRREGRQGFLPLSFMRRIIDRVKPDMVVTTNSPRSERAATQIANERNIPTLAMIDLFGILNLFKLESKYITVLSQRVIDNMISDTGAYPNQQFLITGNPAFDRAFDYRGPINHNWRRTHFPTIERGAKALLWLDEGSYTDRKTGLARQFTDEETTANLDQLAHAAKANNSTLLIRPHPSQTRALFDAWIQKKADPRILFAGDVPLYPLLNAVDAVVIYTSTVGCEALLMQRPVIQLNYYPGTFNMHLGEWGLARTAATPADLPKVICETFDHNQSSDVEMRVAKEFPQERAAPKVADAIRKILSEGRT